MLGKLTARIRTLPLVYFFILPVFLGFFLLPLLRRGMFLDGLFYGIISRNWAEGIGDAWHLYDADLQLFQGHPPLFFVLEGLLMQCFGDGFWVEGLFMILVLAGIALLFYYITDIVQKTLLGDNASPHFTRFLFPYTLFFFLCMNEVAHLFNNNLLDTLLTLFTLWSVYFSLRAYQKPALAYLYYGLAGFVIYLGFLSKGPVALYPLVTPSLLFFFFKSRQKWQGIFWSVYMLGIVLMSTGCLFLTAPDAFQAMKRYGDIQVLPALQTNVSKNIIMQGGREVNAYHWWQRPSIFFKRLFWDLLGSLIVFTAVFLFYWRCILKRKEVFKQIGNGRNVNRTLSFFLILSLSASVPIILSPTIFVHYFLPAGAVYALFFACALVPLLASVSFFRPVMMRYILMGLSAGILAVGIAGFGKPSRDALVISLADMIKKHTIAQEHIFTDSATRCQLNTAPTFLWVFNAYFVRYARTYVWDIKTTGYETPNLILFHRHSLSDYKDLMKMYKAEDSLQDFLLYRYAGSEDG